MQEKRIGPWVMLEPDDEEALLQAVLSLDFAGRFRRLCRRQIRERWNYCSVMALRSCARIAIWHVVQLQLLVNVIKFMRKQVCRLVERKTTSHFHPDLQQGQSA